MENRFFKAGRNVTLALLFVLSLDMQAAGKLPLPTESFEVNGHKAFIAVAPDASGEKPWCWYAPTVNHLPNQDHVWYFERLLAQGISVAGLNLGEVRGSPASTEKFTAFYDEMVRRGYSRKPVLLGQSRGGLMMLTWAMRHPGKVAAFAGIYPVCNLASWPMKKSSKAVMDDYQMTEPELSRNLSRYNPIDNMQGLLAHKVPLFLVHGDADRLVPYDENGALLRQRYEAGGGSIAVKIIEGEGHKVSPSFFACQELLEFVVKHAGRGK